VSLRFFAGGGQPPQSHEVLRVDDDGTGLYLTGMPWPAQAPFDEIGVYRVEGAAGLAPLARAALDAPAGEPGRADSGSERVEIDGRAAGWSPAARGAEAQAFVAAAREVIAAARERPIAVVRAELGDDRTVTLHNRGERAVPVADGSVRAGWGAADRVPDLLRIASAPPSPVALPATLEPGAAARVSLPEPVSRPEGDMDRPYALVGLRWRPGVPDERDELDGWILAGPG
jgi:hypothetical protein